MKLTEEEIRKAFENYSPPRWMIEIIQRIGKEYAERIIDKCAEIVSFNDDIESLYDTIKDLKYEL